MIRIVALEYLVDIYQFVFHSSFWLLANTHLLLQHRLEQLFFCFILLESIFLWKQYNILIEILTILLFIFNYFCDKLTLFYSCLTFISQISFKTFFCLKFLSVTFQNSLALLYFFHFFLDLALVWRRLRNIRVLKHRLNRLWNLLLLMACLYYWWFFFFCQLLIRKWTLCKNAWTSLVFFCWLKKCANFLIFYLILFICLTQQLNLLTKWLLRWLLTFLMINCAYLWQILILFCFKNLINPLLILVNWSHSWWALSLKKNMWRSLLNHLISYNWNITETFCILINSTLSRKLFQIHRLTILIFRILS